VLGLEGRQLHLQVLSLLIGVVQQLPQLLAVLNLLLLDLRQTVLLLWHDDVEGQLLLLSGDTHNLHLVVLVIVELALALNHLSTFRLLAAQRIEAALFRGLLLAELLAPLGVQLQGADGDHFRVLRDGLLRYGGLQFLIGLGRDQAIDLLAALLRITLERALFHLTAQALLNGLRELVLSGSLLIQNDGRGNVDFGALLTTLSSGSLRLLHILGGLETADHSGVSLLALLLRQTGALCASDLSFRVASGALL